MIKQFNQMRKMMKQVTNGNFGGLQNMMGGQMPGMGGKMGQMAMNRMARQAKKRQQQKLGWRYNSILSSFLFSQYPVSIMRRGFYFG